MELPSVNTLASQAATAVKRFPLALLSAIVATLVLMDVALEEWNLRDIEHFEIAKLLMCSELGLCLFIASALISEAREHSPTKKIAIQVFILIVITVYYFSIGHYEKFNINSFTRFTLYVTGAHLLVSFAPFTGPNKINGFWQFNKALFLRFLLSMLYTCALYAGISLAFFLINKLLHVEIRYTIYLSTWYFLAITFNTFVFLAGIPVNINSLDSDSSYPKGLKTFTQFVLLPLVTVYLLILYSYFFRIISNWSLPEGYVSYFVISVSIAGILSLLLIYPIRNSEENKWIKIFSRWFYVALYPLIFLLAIAIYKRISDYGITEHRYFILILAAWLVFTAAYFLLSKKENIKLIPFSLCLLSLLTSMGPWGAFSVSQHSQKNRLERILIKYGMLVDGKLKAPAGNRDLDWQDRRSIGSIMDYLINTDALDILPYNADTLRTMMDIEVTEKYANHSKPPHFYHSEGKTVTFNNANSLYSTCIDIKGFEYFSHLSYAGYNYTDTIRHDTSVHQAAFYACNHPLILAPSPIRNRFWIYRMPHGKMYAMNMDNFIDNLDKKYDTSATRYNFTISDEDFCYDIKMDSLMLRFAFANMSIYILNKKIMLNSFDVNILSKKIK